MVGRYGIPIFFHRTDTVPKIFSILFSILLPYRNLVVENTEYYTKKIHIDNRQKQNSINNRQNVNITKAINSILAGFHIESSNHGITIINIIQLIPSALLSSILFQKTQIQNFILS